MEWTPVEQMREPTDLMLGFFMPNRYGLVYFDRRMRRWMTDDDREAIALTHVMDLPDEPISETYPVK
jgi:hypothetical protein